MTIFRFKARSKSPHPNPLPQAGEGILYLIFLFLIFFTININAAAADLNTVFFKALSSDPTLRIADATKAMQQENVPIQRAALLPNVSAESNYTYQPQTDDSGINPNNTSWSVTATQPLFNANSWFSYQSSKISSQAADYTYSAAIQNLIIRVTQAYFAVLQAQDELRFQQEQQQSLVAILKLNKSLFRAGLAKRVDVDSAEAAVASNISAVLNIKNQLQQTQDALTAITHTDYATLAVLQTTVPLISPQPASLQTWLTTVNDKNLIVLADRYMASADKVGVNAQAANHYPSLSANVGYTQNVENSPYNLSATGANAGVTLSVPIFAGGGTSAHTQQAAYQYEKDLDQIDLDLQAALQQAKDNFYALENGIEQVQADRASLSITKRTLTSTQISYRAGLSNTNIQSVITAQQNLYQAESNLAKDQYAYVISLLKLKQAAGTLSVDDVEQINRWLVK